MLKSWTLTLPEPPPPPTCMLPDCDSPQDQARTSISPLCLSSLASPPHLPILINMSTAIIISPNWCYSRRGCCFDAITPRGLLWRCSQARQASLDLATLGPGECRNPP